MIMRRAMIKTGITLRELSELTGIGVVSLSAIERDCKSDVSADQVAVLRKILGVSFLYLLDPDYRVRAREKWDEEDNYFRQLAEARKSIVEHNTMDVRERVVECPRCKRRLHYTVHYNGNVWAKCETEGCLCWME